MELPCYRELFESMLKQKRNSHNVSSLVARLWRDVTGRLEAVGEGESQGAACFTDVQCTARI